MLTYFTNCLLTDQTAYGEMKCKIFIFILFYFTLKQTKSFLHSFLYSAGRQAGKKTFFIKKTKIHRDRARLELIKRKIFISSLSPTINEIIRNESKKRKFMSMLIS